jgi:hypothetical protein
MTFVDIVTAVSERVLRERTFELVIAPAIADLQYDAPSSALLRRLRHRVALVSTLLWAAWEDATSESDALTFLALTLIPACYYLLLMLVCTPADSFLRATHEGRLLTGAVILVLSLGPVIACYWPERPARRVSMER